MYCKNCGKEMKETERFCPSCGALNLEHPENKQVKDMLENNKAEKTKEKKQIVYSDDYNGYLFYISNLVIYIIFLLVAYISTKGSMMGFITLGSLVTILDFYIFCLEKLAVKDNLPWWGFYIPIYNVLLYYELATGSTKLFWIIFLAPIVAGILSSVLIPLSSILTIIVSLLTIVINIAVMANLGTKFGHSAFLTVIIYPIMLPIIAFSK